MINVEKLQYKRKAKGLSQERFGKLLGVSKQMVSHWENGRNEISPKYHEKIYEILQSSKTNMTKDIAGMADSNINSKTQKVLDRFGDEIVNVAERDAKVLLGKIQKRLHRELEAEFSDQPEELKIQAIKIFIKAPSPETEELLFDASLNRISKRMLSVPNPCV